MKDVCLALKNVNGFEKTSSDNKIVVTTQIINHAPVDNLLNQYMNFLKS